MGCSLSSVAARSRAVRSACCGELPNGAAGRRVTTASPPVEASPAMVGKTADEGAPAPNGHSSEAAAESNGHQNGEGSARRERKTTNLDLLGQEEIWGQEENVLDHVKQWAHQQEKANESRASAMGIWQGVIFPCMSNILGVILFLRLPWIIGKAGIFSGFGLVFVCCLCTFITSLSLSAVATNGKILGGGSYYLISRSLGPALGAGVGLCFYMANSIGAAMYFMGTVEAWEIAAPNYQLLTAGELNNIRVTGFLILAVALVVVAGGIKYVAKVGTVFLFIVLFVILIMYLGLFIGPTDDGAYKVDVVDAAGKVTAETMQWSGISQQNFMENFWPQYDAPQKAFPLDTVEYNFIALMGLWFPACTGIMAGSNRSADLKDPASYIPRGTLFAQLSTSAIYLSFAVLYGCTAPRETLLNDKFFASSSAWPLKQLVVYGVIASTIGAGLTSLTSGCRLLSAIALDKTLPVLAVFGVQPGKEPRMALLASGVLCACAIAIGQLNTIAPVLTMFFLMCYVCVNMSCAVLEAVGDPNWRPRFGCHHWSVSLVGALLCLWMMFAMNPIMAAVAMLFCACVFSYASFNSAQAKWGDGFQGMKFQIAKNILTKMDIQVHAKNWRPQLLVVAKANVSESSETGRECVNVENPDLLKFVSQLKGGRGFVIVGGICCNGAYENYIEGAGMFSGMEKFMASDGQEAMQKLLNDYGISGFGKVIYTHDFQEGLMGLVQNAGLGSFQPNSVITSWPPNWRNQTKEGELARTHLIRLVQASCAFNKMTLIPKGRLWPNSLVRLGGFIDIWWIVGEGGILLLLPFLLKKHQTWRDCRTRLWVLADKVGDDPEKVKSELKHYVTEFRLDIEVLVKIVDEKEIDFGGESLGRSNSFAAAAEQRKPLSPLDVEVGELHFDTTELVRTMSGMSREEMSEGDNFDAAAHAAPARALSRYMEGMARTAAVNKKSGFLHSKDQLTSTKPMSQEDLMIPRGLNKLILSESKEAELVVTNLPDMSKSESAFGYFQFVDAMTKGLPRVVLVRGTSSEVITAFT